MAHQLNYRQPNASCSARDQHGLARLEAATHHQREPGSLKDQADGRSILERPRVRDAQGAVARATTLVA